jgi:hypothetical protein
MHKRLHAAHKSGIKVWFKKTQTNIKHLIAKVKTMDRKKLILIGGGIALTGLAGYFVVRFYVRKFDGKSYFLKGVSKSHEASHRLAEDLRMKGFLVRVEPLRIFGTEFHRVYARKAPVA